MSTTITYSLGLEEFNSKKYILLKSTIGEFIGNMILNFFACGACSQQEDGTFKSLSFGLGVFMAITIVGNISGGQVNPAVTIAMLLTGRASLIRSIFYIAAQCLGAVVGTCAVKALLDEDYHNGFGHISLAANISELQGLGIEFFLGLLLVLTVFSTCDPNKPDSHYTAPFAIGMSVTLGHLGTIRYTGCGMNPARTFGTAFVLNNWESHWVYWAGPILGGIVAAFLYTRILAKSMETLKPSEASDMYRIHAYERERKKIEDPSNFV